MDRRAAVQRSSVCWRLFNRLCGLHNFFAVRVAPIQQSKSLLTAPLLCTVHPGKMTDNAHKTHQPPVGSWHVTGMAQYQEMYKQSVEDPDQFWAEQAQGMHWEKPWTFPLCK